MRKLRKYRINIDRLEASDASSIASEGEIKEDNKTLNLSARKLDEEEYPRNPTLPSYDASSF